MTDSYSQGKRNISSLLDIQLKIATSIPMQVDAVGESTQSQSALSALPAQAASSDDCSTVKLNSSDPAHDGATSMLPQPAAEMQSPAHHAQQSATSDNLQQHPTFQHQTAAPSTSRLLRKRKQPPSEEEQHIGPSASAPNNAAVEQDRAASAEQDGLGPALSRRKGKSKGSKAPGGPTEAPSKSRRTAALSASGQSPTQLVVVLPV